MMFGITAFVQFLNIMSFSGSPIIKNKGTYVTDTILALPVCCIYRFTVKYDIGSGFQKIFSTLHEDDRVWPKHVLLAT
jgi:hypothetical protein